jgi:hypothetical protein
MTYSTAIVPALLVDEAMAHRFFPGEDPIGKRTTVPWGADAEEPSYEVGGAVSSVHHDGPATPPEPTLYTLRGHDATQTGSTARCGSR